MIQNDMFKQNEVPNVELSREDRIRQEECYTWALEEVMQETKLVDIVTRLREMYAQIWFNACMRAKNLPEAS